MVRPNILFDDLSVVKFKRITIDSRPPASSSNPEHRPWLDFVNLMVRGMYYITYNILSMQVHLVMSRYTTKFIFHVWYPKYPMHSYSLNWLYYLLYL